MENPENKKTNMREIIANPEKLKEKIEKFKQGGLKKCDFIGRRLA